MSSPSELDIESIKRRHLRKEQMEHRTFYEGHIVIDLAACVDEIERLREELGKLRGRT
jgi:hypothetical protein